MQGVFESLQCSDSRELSCRPRPNGSRRLLWQNLYPFGRVQAFGKRCRRTWIPRSDTAESQPTDRPRVFVGTNNSLVMSMVDDVPDLRPCISAD